MVNVVVVVGIVMVDDEDDEDIVDVDTYDDEEIVDEEETIEGQAKTTPDADDQAKSVIEHSDDDDELSDGEEPNTNGNPFPIEELLEELEDDELDEG